MLHNSTIVKIRIYIFDIDADRCLTYRYDDPIFAMTGIELKVGNCGLFIRLLMERDAGRLLLQEQTQDMS